jgi:hypothetical protein
MCLIDLRVNPLNRTGWQTLVTKLFGKGNCGPCLSEKVEGRVEILDHISGRVNKSVKTKTIVHCHDHRRNRSTVVRGLKTEGLRIPLDDTPDHILGSIESVLQ